MKQGMFECPVVDEAYVKEIGVAGPDANEDQVANAIRNCERVCEQGIAPEFFIVDGKRFGTIRHVKGPLFPLSYTEGEHWPYIIGKAGSMTDLGDPGFMAKGDTSRIVGRISEDNTWFFVRADGSRRPFTTAENIVFDKLIVLKEFTSMDYYDAVEDQVVTGELPITYFDPILCKEIITVYMDI